MERLVKFWVSLEFDLRDEGGAYFRIKVTIDVGEPLCPGFPLKMKGANEKWTDVKYEGLLNFCFSGGTLGHEARLCEVATKRDEFYGP